MSADLMIALSLEYLSDGSIVLNLLSSYFEKIMMSEKKFGISKKVFSPIFIYR